MKVLGRDSLQFDRDVIELRFVEQIADTEQIAALGYLLKYAGTHFIDGRRNLIQIVDLLEKKVAAEGLAALADDGYRQEIFACIDRCRSMIY